MAKNKDLSFIKSFQPPTPLIYAAARTTAMNLFTAGADDSKWLGTVIRNKGTAATFTLLLNGVEQSTFIVAANAGNGTVKADKLLLLSDGYYFDNASNLVKEIPFGVTVSVQAVGTTSADVHFTSAVGDY